MAIAVFCSAIGTPRGGFSIGRANAAIATETAILEYQTKSPAGPKNPGWKDSGNAILYEDGTPVPAPLATCELQGYWFAAQQMAAVISWILGTHEEAKAYSHAASELKARFNRDWWMEDDTCVARALDLAEG